MVVVAEDRILGRDSAKQYEILPMYEYGQERPRESGQSPVGNARKCHFCLHRTREGRLPACLEACPTGARIFGDLNDPDSQVSRVLATREAYVLKPDAGTTPKHFYLK